MKKSVIKNTAAAVALLSALTFSSCLSTSGLTDGMSLAATVLSSDGDKTAAKSLQAISDISKAAESITPENEYYIGRSVAATLLTNYETYDNAALESYLNKICAVLVEHSDMPELYNGYHVKALATTSEVNAFSTSGGHIFVTRGLLSCTTDEDALAAVIAHEIAHIQLHHSIDSIKASRNTGAVLSSLDAAASMSGVNHSKLGNEMSKLMNDAIENLVNSGFSQDQEFEADALALELLRNAGYSPDAMVDMLNAIQSAQGSKKNGVYKTHPSAKDRLKKVEKKLGKIGSVSTDRADRTSRYNKAMGN